MLKIRQRANLSDQPLKIAIPIAVSQGLLKEVKAYWAGGQASAGPFACNFKPTSKPGFEVVVKVGPSYRSGRQPQCALPADQCDSSGEFCEYVPVVSACYVNVDWLMWYRAYLKQHQLDKQFDEARICAILS